MWYNLSVIVPFCIGGISMNRGLMLRKIKDADKAYYMDDNPIMSDTEYDALRNQYISLYGSKDLDYVSGGVKKGLKSFKHICNINSLKKIRYNEVEKLREEFRRLAPVLIEPKYDGLTVVAYPSGEFVTRGGGTEGEVLNNFPDKYKGNNFDYPIRGEAYLTVDDFEIINAKQRELGLKEYENPRNACAGIIRRLDDSPYKNYVRYVCYDVLNCDWGETEKLQYIADKTNFEVAEFYLPKAEDLADVLSRLYAKWKNESTPIDGLVVKCMMENSLEKFGSTDHHPKNAFAYKAEDETAVTDIIDVEWQVGRESVTPIAVFEPVRLEGTTVEKASLSNVGIFKSLDLHKGDSVIVFKANQIIPQIKSVVMRNGGEKLEIPHECPVCGGKLEVRKNLDNYTLICNNELCSGKLVNRIEYMFSKKCLNAKGLSKKSIEKMLQWIGHPVDIFNITKEQILSIEGFKDKSAENLYNSIQTCRKNVPLDVFIASVGFLGIGSDVGKTLAKKYKTYDKILEVVASVSSFMFLSLS
jgi:DNA ligase (NAD+)